MTAEVVYVTQSQPLTQNVSFGESQEEGEGLVPDGVGVVVDGVSLATSLWRRLQPQLDVGVWGVDCSRTEEGGH